MPSALTIDQLRAYLERREREASALVGRAIGEGNRDLYNIFIAHSNLYRELLAAIETGEVPE